MADPLSDELTCFIAGESSPENLQLRTRLENRHVTCFSIDRLTPSMGARLIASNILSLVQRSDFVAAVVPPEPSPNLLVELGYAFGRGKPLLIFAHDRSAIPASLASVNVLSVGLLDSTEQDDYIDAFLRSVRPSNTTPPPSTLKKDAAASRRWKSIRDQFSRLSEEHSRSFGLDFEKIVERAFKSGGFSISRAPTVDFGADFALASPKLIEAFGLPLLVETKNNSRNELHQSALGPVSSLIRQGRGGAALVVTVKPDAAAVSLHLEEAIVIVSARELFDWLQAGAFEKKIVDAVDSLWAKER